MSLDACFVLAGSVLTAFVGCEGLLRRLALDRSMPGFLLQTNRWRGTNHWIILCFCGSCIALYALLKGDVKGLANIYALAFLSVMGMFALGNMMLKYKRGRIRREVVASWPTSFSALVAVLIALAGNIVANPQSLIYFAIYLAVIVFLLSLVFTRVRVARFFMYLIKRGPGFLAPIVRGLQRYVQDTQQQPVVFLSKDSNLEVLNKAITYIRENELCSWIKVVSFVGEDAAVDERTAALGTSLAVGDVFLQMGGSMRIIFLE